MEKKLTVLCASAHPDDIELQCAGTLIRYVKEGHKVIMAVACTGNVGSKIHTGPEIEAIRAGEAQESCRYDWRGINHARLQGCRCLARPSPLDNICGSDPAHQSGCDHYPRP